MTPRPPVPPSHTPVGSAGLRTRLAAGAGTLGGVFVLWSVLQILSVPILMKQWGTGLYGDWITLNAVTGLLTLLDAGLQLHLTGQMRTAAAAGDWPRAEGVLADGLGLYTAILLAGAGVLGVAYGAVDLPGLLHVKAADATLTGVLLGVTTLLVLPRGLVGCVLSARGQLSRETLLGGAQQILPLVAQLTVAVAGGGLAAAAAAGLMVSLVVGWGVLLAAVRRWHPDVGLRMRWPTAPALRSYTRKAGLHSLPLMSMTLLLHVPVLLLQRFFPAEAAGGAAVIIYTTMRTFAGTLRQTATQILIAVALEMVRQHVQKDRQGLARLFAAATRFSGGGAGFLSALLVTLGDPLFVLWTHGTVRFDPLLAAVFMGTVLVMMPALYAMTLLRYADHAEPLAMAYAVQTVVGIGLCAALIPPYQAIGGAVAVGVAEIVAAGLPSLRHTARLFGIAAFRLAGESWLVTATGFVVGWGAAWALMAGGLATATLADLAAFAAVWGMVVLPAAFIILLPASERRWLWRQAGGGWRKRRSCEEEER